MNTSHNKYEARTRMKKEAILQAALFYFQKKGFKETSVKEIASKAQVSQVSIYNYYGNKDALVIECARVIMHDILEEAILLLHTDMPYLDKLNKALSLCTGEINTSLTEYFSASALADADFMHLLFDGITELQKDVYAKYIEAGKKEGYIDPSFPTSTILKFIMAFNTIEVSTEFYATELNVLHNLFLHGILIQK